MPIMSQNKRGIRNNQYNMNSNSKGQLGTGQKIRLRRNITKQQVIQKNLSHMQQSAQKKKVAQELYYSQQGSRSPLLRANTVNNKAPVHNRLGHNNLVNNVIKKPLIRTQNGNRIKLRRQVIQPDQMIRNNIIRRRNDKMKRTQSVQNRILRIRQNQTQIKQISQNNGQKVRLRRMRQGPVNYTVQVLNNPKARPPVKHSLTKGLSPKLQEEIRLIQTKSIQHAEIPSIPIHPQGTGYTGTTLHERFSQL